MVEVWLWVKYTVEKWAFLNANDMRILVKFSTVYVDIYKLALKYKSDQDGTFNMMSVGGNFFLPPLKLQITENNFQFFHTCTFH